MKKLHETLSFFLPKFHVSNFSDAVNYIHDIKTQFSNNPDEYESFRKTLLGITEARFSCDGDTVTLQEIQESDVERIKAKLEGHRDLLATLDTYLPPKYRSDHSEIETKKEVLSDDDHSEIETKKEVLSNADHSEIETKKEVLSNDEVRSLSKFSDDNPSNPSATKEAEKTKRKSNFEEVSVCDTDANKTIKKIRAVTYNFLGKVSNRLPESRYMDVLGSLYHYSMEELKNSVEEMEKRENILDFVGDLKHYLKQCEEIAAKDRMQQQKERKIHERIYKVAESCPSSTLDYLYNCKGSKSDYTVKHKIDKKEDIANKIEDDQLQLDLLIEWFKSAIIYAKFLLEKDQTEEKLEKKKMGEEEQLKKEVEHNEKLFERLFMRCLEEMDKDYIINDLYKEDPEKALPVILRRFQLKLKEFLAFKEECDRRCREAYETHFSSKKKENS